MAVSLGIRNGVLILAAAAGPRSTPSLLPDGGRAGGGGGGGSEAAADQSRPQEPKPARHPAPHRPGRPAELSRRLLTGQALQVAEHNRRAVFRRQTVDLL